MQSTLSKRRPALRRQAFKIVSVSTSWYPFFFKFLYLSNGHFETVSLYVTKGANDSQRGPTLDGHLDGETDEASSVTSEFACGVATLRYIYRVSLFCAK